MFPEMKELLNSWIKEIKARAEEHEANGQGQLASRTS
jgi:hypothetical protein